MLPLEQHVPERNSRYESARNNNSGSAVGTVAELRDGQSGVRITAGGRAFSLLQNVHSGPRAHPDS